MSRLRFVLVLSGLASALACGDAAKAPASGAAPAAAATPEPVKTVPPPAGPSRADAEPLDAHAWWSAVARGELEGAALDGESTYAKLGQGDAARMVVAETAALQDRAARDAGYREAVEMLVLSLRTASERTAALTRLEALTKTQRGAWENWLKWHDEHGDYLAYNAELDRVDVDAKRMAAKAPVAQGGLALGASLSGDRVGRDAPLQLKLQLRNTNTGEDAAPVLVNQRMAIGHEIIVEIRAHERDDAAQVELKPPGDAPALRAESFAVLEPGGRIDATFDLGPKLSAPLEPGHYMVRVTYRSDEDGEGLGLSGTPWTGEIRSVRSFVRVVPW